MLLFRQQKISCFQKIFLLVFFVFLLFATQSATCLAEADQNKIEETKTGLRTYLEGKEAADTNDFNYHPYQVREAYDTLLAIEEQDKIEALLRKAYTYSLTQESKVAVSSGDAHDIKIRLALATYEPERSAEALIKEAETLFQSLLANIYPDKKDGHPMLPYLFRAMMQGSEKGRDPLFRKAESLVSALQENTREEALIKAKQYVLLSLFSTKNKERLYYAESVKTLVARAASLPPPEYGYYHDETLQKNSYPLLMIASCCEAYALSPTIFDRIRTFKNKIFGKEKESTEKQRDLLKESLVFIKPDQSLESLDDIWVWATSTFFDRYMEEYPKESLVRLPAARTALEVERINQRRLWSYEKSISLPGGLTAKELVLEAVRFDPANPEVLLSSADFLKKLAEDNSFAQAVQYFMFASQAICMNTAKNMYNEITAETVPPLRSSGKMVILDHSGMNADWLVC